MAIENKVFLNGQIRRLRKIKNDEGNVTQIQLGLLVIRRPKKNAGNRLSELQQDVVVVQVMNKEMIEKLIEERAAEGDVAQVCGTFCTVHVIKRYYCRNCGQINEYEGTASYVHPLFIDTSEIKPKRLETIYLSPSERIRPRNEILKLLDERKTFDGKIIKVEDLGEDEDGKTRVRITVREPITDEEAIHWLIEHGEVSNDAFFIGNLCADPVYNPIDNGGRVCTYELGINRKVFIGEDAPEVRSDFPWVKSLGDQADKDRLALKKGSRVFIEGAIQARTVLGEKAIFDGGGHSRTGYKVKKECETCGAINEVSDGTMEIIPYSVEYLSDCNTDILSDGEDEDLLDAEEDDQDEENEDDDDGDEDDEDNGDWFNTES